MTYKFLCQQINVLIVNKRKHKKEMIKVLCQNDNKKSN